MYDRAVFMRKYTIENHTTKQPSERLSYKAISNPTKSRFGPLFLIFFPVVIL